MGQGNDRSIRPKARRCYQEGVIKNNIGQQKTTVGINPGLAAGSVNRQNGRRNRMEIFIHNISSEGYLFATGEQQAYSGNKYKLFHMKT